MLSPVRSWAGGFQRELGRRPVPLALSSPRAAPARHTAYGTCPGPPPRSRHVFITQDQSLFSPGGGGGSERTMGGDGIKGRG